MRLIDADALIKKIDEMGKATEIQMNKLDDVGKINFGKGILQGIAIISAYVEEKVPTAYDVDAVVQELEEEQEKEFEKNLVPIGNIDCCKAIEIVKGGMNERAN